MKRSADDVAVFVDRQTIETALIKKLRKMRGYDLALIASSLFEIDCKRVGKSNTEFILNTGISADTIISQSFI